MVGRIGISRDYTGREFERTLVGAPGAFVGGPLEFLEATQGRSSSAPLKERLAPFGRRFGISGGHAGRGFERALVGAPGALLGVLWSFRMPRRVEVRACPCKGAWAFLEVTQGQNTYGLWDAVHRACIMSRLSYTSANTVVLIAHPPISLPVDFKSGIQPCGHHRLEFQFL